MRSPALALRFTAVWCLILLFASSAIGQDPATLATDDAATLLGKWSGELTEKDDSYPVLLELIRSGDFLEGGVDYDSSKCRSELIFTGSQNGVFSFDEKYASGRLWCQTTGRVTLTSQASGIMEFKRYDRRGRERSRTELTQGPSEVDTKPFVPAVKPKQKGLLGRAVEQFGNNISGSAMTPTAQREWAAVDVEVVTCLHRAYRINVDQLVRAGIRPGHSRVMRQLESCTIQVEEARQIAEKKRIEDELRQAEQQRLAEEEERRRKEQEAAARAAAAAQERARRDALVKQFGESAAAAIIAGRIEIGMTKEAVLAAKGQPSSREAIPPDFEVWYYGKKSVSFGSGKVTYTEL